MKAMTSKEQKKISDPVFELFKREETSQLSYLFFEYPSQKLVELEMVPLKNKKINRESTIELMNQIVYTWFVTAHIKQRLQFKKAYLEVNSDEITIFIKCERIPEQSGTPLTLLEFMRHLEELFNRISKQTSFLPMDKNDSIKNNEDIMIYKFIQFYRRVRESKQYSLIASNTTQEQRFSILDQDSPSNIGFLEALEQNILMNQKYFLLRVYADSIFKATKQIPNFTLLLKRETILLKCFTNRILKEENLKMYKIAQADYQKEIKTSEMAFQIKKHILESKSKFSLKKDAVFYQNLSILAHILQGLSKLELIKDLTDLRNDAIFEIQEQEEFCVRFKYLRFTFVVSITRQKEIIVSLQTDIKVFAEEKDMRLHWISLLHPCSNSLGARIGMTFEHHRKKTKPLFTDSYVILLASDMYTDSGLYMKVAFLMDSLITGYYILEPGLRQFRTMDYLADNEIEMGRKMELMCGIMAIKYAQQEQTSREK